jgi:hypothetical protein
MPLAIRPVDFALLGFIFFQGLDLVLIVILFKDVVDIFTYQWYIWYIV